MSESKSFIVEGSEADAAQRELQREFFQALASGYPAAIETCKQRFIAEFPDQLLGVSILFDLPSTLKALPDYTLRDDTKAHEALIAKSQLAETIRSFILHNASNERFLATFWSFVSAIGQETNTVAKTEGLHKSIQTEIAAYHALEQAGTRPTFAPPRWDVLGGTDILIREGTEYVQVKGGVRGRPFLVSSRSLATTSAIAQVIHNLGLDENGRTKEFWEKEFRDFEYGVKWRDKEYGGPRKTYLTAIPYDFTNELNGDPTPDLVEVFAGYFRKH